MYLCMPFKSLFVYLSTSILRSGGKSESGALGVTEFAVLAELAALEMCTYDSSLALPSCISGGSGSMPTLAMLDPGERGEAIVQRRRSSVANARAQRAQISLKKNV